MPTKRRRRRDLIMVTPRRAPRKGSPLDRAHHEMRQLRNKIHEQDQLILALNQQLGDAQRDSANAEHAMRMARPTEPQLSALRAVCLISVLDCYRIAPGLASAISELSRWLVDLSPSPAPDTVTCQTALPFPPGTTVTPLPAAARAQQRKR